MMKAYLQWIVRQRKWVILTSVLLTMFFALQLTNLTVLIDPDKSVPQTHPLIVATNRIEALFGNKFTAIIVVTPTQGDAFQPEILRKIQRITAKIAREPTLVRSSLVSLSARKVKSISGSEAGLEVKPLLEKVPTTPAEMAALRAALQFNPAYENLIISKDQTALCVVADFKVPHGFTPIAQSLKAIIDVERDASVDISLGGVPIFLSLLEHYSARMSFLFPLAMLIIGLIHYEAFRTLQALFLPLVTAILAVLWGLGFMGLAGVPLDVFNATTPILILAIAAGHAVQILKRYYEEYHRIRSERPSLEPGEASQEAVIAAVCKIGPVMIAAGSIAALGFFSLAIFEIQTIQTFGIFTGMGILSALVLEMTLIPALRSTLSPPSQRESQREKQITFWDRIVTQSCDLVLFQRKHIYIITAALSAVLLVGATWVKVDNSQKALFYGKLVEKQDDEKLNTQMAGSNAVYLLIEGKEADAIKSPKVLQAMESVQEFLAQEALVGKTISLADFIKRIHRAMNAEQPEFDVIPADQNLIAQYLLLYSTSGEPGDFDSYVDYHYQNANILAFVKTDSTSEINALGKRLMAFAETQFGPEVRVQVGGGTTGSIALNEVMIREKLLNIAQIMGVVFLISSLLFQSFIGGALICVPLVTTVLANFGALGLFGIPLQIFTALVSAMAVGIGADYAIYLSYRIREELERGGSESDAVRRAFASAGKAILFVSSAIAGGYAVLIFSFGFLLHLWMGILIALAMLVSSISALTLFPALLLTLRPKFIFRKSAEEPIRRNKAPALVSPLLILGAVGALLLTAPVSSAAESPEEIMRKNFAVSRVIDSDSEATFTLVNNSGQERVRKTRVVTKLIEGTTDNRRMVRFLSPPDVKGTVSLMIEHSGKDDDLWIYLPALKKVRRLVASNKKDAFVGTDFSYGDVIGHRVEDWKHQLMKEATVEGKDCYLVESTPRNEEITSSSGYSKRLTWIDRSNFVALKGEFYDLNGQLLKTAQASQIEEVDAKNGKWQPRRMVMKNVQTGHSTMITIENFKTNVGVKDDYFTTRYMEKEG
jgi:predicted RND superfamily exporter protein/outer membrane lipoprotein-sorting protein